MGLSPKTRELYDLLKDTNGWQSRNDIARILGKKRLSSHDVTKLEVLNSEGLIESEKQPIPNQISRRWMYRTIKE